MTGNADCGEAPLEPSPQSRPSLRRCPPRRGHFSGPAVGPGSSLDFRQSSGHGTFRVPMASARAPDQRRGLSARGVQAGAAARVGLHRGRRRRSGHCPPQRDVVLAVVAAGADDDRASRTPAVDHGCGRRDRSPGVARPHGGPWPVAVERRPRGGPGRGGRRQPARPEHRVVVDDRGGRVGHACRSLLPAVSGRRRDGDVDAARLARRLPRAVRNRRRARDRESRG